MYVGQCANKIYCWPEHGLSFTAQLVKYFNLHSNRGNLDYF